MARFVVARDVAESMVADQRHPLLIEVLEPGYAALNESQEECAKREESKQWKRRASLLLVDRIARAADEVSALVKATAKQNRRNPDRELKAARVDPLRRFVAARLTPDEIQQIAVNHKQFNVYAVWQSASKRKLISRSRAVLQADAALESYGARGRGHHLGRARHGRAIRPSAFLDRHHHRHLGLHADGRAGQTRDRPRSRRAWHRTSPASSRAPIPSRARNYKGVAPQARLVIYKVLNDQGEGEDAWIIKALDHIAEQNEQQRPPLRSTAST